MQLLRPGDEAQLKLPFPPTPTPHGTRGPAQQTQLSWEGPTIFISHTCSLGLLGLGWDCSKSWSQGESPEKYRTCQGHHRAGERAESPACVSTQGLTMAQASGGLGTVPSSATLGIWVPLPLP